MDCNATRPLTDRYGLRYGLGSGVYDRNRITIVICHVHLGAVGKSCNSKWHDSEGNSRVYTVCPCVNYRDTWKPARH